MEEFSDGGSTPPASTKKKDICESRCLSFWVSPPTGRLHPSVIKMLGRNQSALRNSPLRCEFTPHSRRGPKGPYILLDDRLRQGFRPCRKRLHGAKAPPRCAGPWVPPPQRRPHLAYFHLKLPNVKFCCLKQRAVFPYNRYTWDRR